MEFHIGKVKVRSKFVNHPGICVGYRLFTSSGSVAFLPDNEPYESLKIHSHRRDGISDEEARDFRRRRAREVGRVSARLRRPHSRRAIHRRRIHGAHRLGPRLVEHAWFRSRLKPARRSSFFPSRPESRRRRWWTQWLERARDLVAESGKTLEMEAAREGAEIVLGAKTPVA